MMSRKLFKSWINDKAVDGEILVHILKEREFTIETLTDCINKYIQNDCFPDSLKEANVNFIFKKDDYTW